MIRDNANYIEKSILFGTQLLFCSFLRKAVLSNEVYPQSAWSEPEWKSNAQISVQKSKIRKLLFYNKCFKLKPSSHFMRKCPIHHLGCFKVGLQRNAADKILSVLPQQSLST